VNNIGISERFVSDLVKSVRGIGDEFSQKYFFVGVESVDDEAHQLLDISIEGKVLILVSCSHIWDIITPPELKSIYKV
jgi:hypothetical protein